MQHGSSQKEESVNQDRNETAQEFMEEIAEDLGYAPKGEKNQGSGLSMGQGHIPTYLILGGVGVVLFIAVTAFFLMSKGGGRPQEFAAFQARLNRLEERMSALTKLEERTAVLARLEERMTRLEGMKGLKTLAGLEDRIDRLEKGAKDLQQEIQKTATRNEPPPAAPKKAAPDTKKRYHTVKAGESIYMIARTYGISVDKLCQLNKISPKKASIQPGQKLLVGP